MNVLCDRFLQSDAVDILCAAVFSQSITTSAIVEVSVSKTRYVHNELSTAKKVTTQYALHRMNPN